MSFFSALASSLASPSGSGVGAASAGAQAPLPTIREDTYKAISAAESWLSTPNAPGDGLSFRPVLALLQPHFPTLKAPLPLEEVQVIVGWVTNLTFELGKVDGMAGVMVMQTWVESLGRAYRNIQGFGDRKETERMGAGIVQGIQVVADPARVTRDLATRVQTIGSLKKVAAIVYGDGSEQARQADAYWSSKMML